MRKFAKFAILFSLTIVPDATTYKKISEEDGEERKEKELDGAGGDGEGVIVAGMNCGQSPPILSVKKEKDENRALLGEEKL